MIAAELLDGDAEHGRDHPQTFEWPHPKPQEDWPAEERRPAKKLTLRLVQPVVAQEDAVERKFRRLVDQWHEETLLHSFIERKIIHPAYQAIIGMGYAAVPLLLRELERAPDHWFWALQAITQENPVATPATMEDAARAWVDWGRERGLV